jgi:hypothetical protein
MNTENPSEELLIPIDEPKKAFEEHLKLPFNDRIFFSGIYGIGKTTFLKKFFEESYDYQVIHLYPVNYSVAANEDIFELIKADILYELLLNYGDKFEITEFSQSLQLSQKLINFLHNHEALAASFIMLLPVLHKELAPVSAALTNLIKSKAEKEIETPAESSEIKDAIEFLKELQRQKGSVWEFNMISELISNILSALKENDTHKTVLIIDDLDRIDPAHIFRILNIFSAHFDKEENNKFGFDHVMVVGDYNNIRSLYHHRYGQEADFSGYMDKFYSREVFEFDYNNIVEKMLDHVLAIENFNIHEKHQSNFQENHDFFLQSTKRVLKRMLGLKVINLRTLLKFNKNYTDKYIIQERPVNERFAVYQSRNKNDARDGRKISLYFRYAETIYFLKSLFGSTYNLINALEKCSQEYDIKQNVPIEPDKNITEEVADFIYMLNYFTNSKEISYSDISNTSFFMNDNTSIKFSMTLSSKAYAPSTDEKKDILGLYIRVSPNELNSLMKHHYHKYFILLLSTVKRMYNFNLL